jgi:hypothetical protein
VTACDECPFLVHSSFRYAAVPSALVLNSAMPVIDNFLHKIRVLQPMTRPGKTSRPVDQRDPGSHTTDAIKAVSDRLHTWLAS